MMSYILINENYFAADRKRESTTGMHKRLSRSAYWAQYTTMGAETVMNMVKFLSALLASTAAVERSFHGYSLCLTVVCLFYFFLAVVSILVWLTKVSVIIKVDKCRQAC